MNNLIANGCTDYEAGWSAWTCEAMGLRALDECRGRYQRKLINGSESVSGSTLHGKAKSYGFQYRKSRDALLARLRKAAIPFEVERVGRRHVLVIG